MEELLSFIIKSITGSDGFEISSEEEGDKVNLNVELDQEYMGLVIGKGGRTIKSIQDILRVKGRLEDKMVFVNIREKGGQVDPEPEDTPEDASDVNETD